MSSPRVLFVHGLESHPNGSKVRLLREQGFDVVAPDLHMGTTQLSRRNSVVRQLLRLREVRFAATTFTIAVAIGIGTSKWPAATATMLVAIIYTAVRGRRLFAAAISRSFEACAQIAREALTKAEPDVVVGSSWGGAIAADLVRSEAWSGPTVLLAPAIAKANRWMMTSAPQALASEQRLRARSDLARIVVFHDPTDDVVPFADSEALVRGSRMSLRSVDGGGHRLMALMQRGEVSQAIHEIAGVTRASVP